MTIRLTTATNAKLPTIARIIEAAPQSEQVIAQSITTSAPDAPMQLLDLAIQYARIRASFVNPYIKILATSLYGAGNNTNTSAITGALDVVLAGETIANSHTMRTTNDVKAFLQSYSYQDMELTDSPAAYYRLGETSGTFVLDSTMLNGAGTITGGVTLGAPGAITGNPGTCMTFNGSSGYVALPASIDPSTYTSGLSIELWLNPGATQTGARVLANSHTDVDNKGFQLAINGGGTGGFFDLGFSAYQVGANFSNAWTVGAWYHVVATYDGATIRLYVNGTPNGTASVGGTMGAASNPINIGRNPAYNGDFFNGSVQEAAIRSYVLSASQVLTHFNVGMGAV